MSDLTDEEIIATRKLHGLNDDLFKEGTDTNVGSIYKDIEILEELKQFLSEYRIPQYTVEQSANAIETVLNMLKEKDKEIEKLKKHNKELLRKLRNRVKEVKKLIKYSLYKKEFKTLNEQLKEKDKEIEKLKKEIDLMAETIRKLAISLANYRGSYNEETFNFTGNIKDIKQYFKNKAEKE